MSTKRIYVCSMHELPQFIPSYQTSVKSTISRVVIVPEWVKLPSSQYKLYTIDIIQEDYDDKMQRLRQGNNIHTMLFILWLRNLVRPRSILADVNILFFGSDDIGCCDCDVFPDSEMVIIGGYHHGIFVGIPHDNYITGLSSFV